MRFVVSVDYNQIYFQENGDVFGFILCIERWMNQPWLEIWVTN